MDSIKACVLPRNYFWDRGAPAGSESEACQLALEQKTYSWVCSCGAKPTVVVSEDRTQLFRCKKCGRKSAITRKGIIRLASL
jgi:predicted SprT family Zn-dependent metalloprotease